MSLLGATTEAATAPRFLQRLDPGHVLLAIALLLYPTVASPFFT